MTETPEQPKPCPICKQDSVYKHCTSPTCPWHRCRNKPCEAVFDFKKKHGFTKDGNGGRRAVTFMPGGEIT